MAPKRKISSANVASKKAKMGREVASLVQQADKVEFQNDLEWLKNELVKNLHKMKQVKSIASLDDTETYDKDKQFNPDIVGRSLSRVPMTFLTKVFLPRLSGLIVQELSMLTKQDPKAAHNIMYRIAHVTTGMAIHTRDKDEWMNAIETRAKNFGATTDIVKFNREFKIDWRVCGHFELLPALPADAAPEAHQYTHISFKGISVPLNEDFIKGTWRIEDNFSHAEAMIIHPTRVNLKFGCSSFFDPARFRLMVPDMKVTQTNLLAIGAPGQAGATAIEDVSVAHDQSEAGSDMNDRSVGAPSIAQTPPPKATVQAPCEPSESASSSSIAPSFQSPGGTQVARLPGVRMTPKAPPARSAAAAALVEELAQAPEEQGCA